MKSKPLPSNRAGWLRRWRSTLRVIRQRVDDLWLDRELYRDWRAVIDANDQLDKRNAYLWLIERSYWNNLLIGIRTFDDHDKRSHSLLRLICEVSENSHLLTKEWFLGRFPALLRNGGIDKLQFKRDWSGRKTISKRRACQDVARLLRACKSVRLVVNRVIAHNSRNPPRRIPKRGEVDATLDTLFSLVSRYHALVFNSEWSHPAGLADPRIFDVAWRAAGPAVETPGQSSQLPAR